MKASDALARYLSTHGFDHCYEVAGGMITHLLDSMARLGETRIISMHHEQAAAFAAEGMARQSRGRRMALAMGTSGPGATNLLTGVGSCWFDSVPCLFITGQVNTTELKGDSGIRQSGFQELDIVPMARTVTKYATQVTSSQELLKEVHTAVSLAHSGRKGPVLIDLPNDVQRGEIPDDEVKKWLNRPLDVAGMLPLLDADKNRIIEACKTARRPLFCFGGGAAWAEGLQEFVERLEQARIPYVSTLLGQQQVVSGDHYLNMIGTYGNRAANWGVQNCDLLLVLGSRLDIRQTGVQVADFARNAQIVRVDIDENELRSKPWVEQSIHAEVQPFFASIDPIGLCPAMESRWPEEAVNARLRNERDEYDLKTLSPFTVFSLINECAKDRTMEFVADVGNNQMWCAHSLRLRNGQAAHYCGGMGAMGFALPTAMGVAISSGKKVLCITGDGGLQINIQELDTLKRLKLDLVVLVLNNLSLGMVKNFQDMYFEGRNQSTKVGYSVPDFVKVSRAYGIDAVRTRSKSGLRKALLRGLESTGPFLIEVVMEDATDCRPRLAFGSKLDEQFP